MIAFLIIVSFLGSSADAGPSSSQRRPNLDPDAASEEGEAMDATNADEEAMMTAMGLAGFGSTKVCSFSNFYDLKFTLVTGQACRWQPRRLRQRQEDEDMASVHESVRVRLQSQRSFPIPPFSRGGFNRPLDKVK